MAKRYSNTTEVLLTERRPNTQVSPKIGSSVTKAFAKDLHWYIAVKRNKEKGRANQREALKSKTDAGYPHAQFPSLFSAPIENEELGVRSLFYFLLFLSLLLFIFKLAPLYVFPSNALLLSIKKHMLAQIKTTTKNSYCFINTNMLCLDLYLKLEWPDADSSFSILEVTRMTITRITRLI